MRLYASEVCACRGPHLPTTGMVRLGIEQCARCWKLRAGTGDEVIPSPRPSWVDTVDDDGRVMPSRERGARQSRLRMRQEMRDAFDGREA